MTPEQRVFLRSRFASVVNDEATALMVDDIARRMGDCDTDDCMDDAIASLTAVAEASDMFLGFGIRDRVLLALSRARRPRPS
jgi:hypothetical protein